jgi:NADPH:quinone reductase-like Zn-dependent oxidoreductase
MQAIAVTEVGGPERLELMDVPVPVPGPDEVLVRVMAAGRQRGRHDVPRLRRLGRAPARHGLRFSGVVAQVGEAVADLTIGDEVYGYKLLGNGTYAEFVVVPAGWVARKPSTISHEQAAGLPCVGLTAYEAVVGALRVSASSPTSQPARKGSSHPRAQGDPISCDEPELQENPRLTSVVRAGDIPTGHEGLTGGQRN